MNRESIIYIHIPKTGGTFVLSTIFFKDNLYAEHYKITTYPNIQNKTIIATIRNPLGFYNSFYNFFKYPNHKITNKFQDTISKFDNINNFLKILLTKKNEIVIDIFADYDKYYFNAKNNYGLLTNYYLYFFNYEKGDIDDFFKNLKQKIIFLKQENLKEDTINFCNKFNILYDKTKIDLYINKNIHNQKLSNELKDLIYKKDFLIFKYFYL